MAKFELKNNLSELEQSVLEYWKREKIFERIESKHQNDKPFVFFEGPPTANAGPAIHHILARAFKDLIPRYQTMRGRRVDRKAGWDTHGLPVELQVEKKLGLKNKKEIEAYGIANFNQQCRADVWTFKADWEKLTERIGFWLDMEHPFITYENEYIESVWHVLKRAHERKLLYRGHKVVPFCTRCGTALSSHEVAQGYKVVEDTSVYIKLRVTEKSIDTLKQKISNFKFQIKNLFILSWTTTPWTLPGNVALAVGADINYVLVKSVHNNEIYIVAQDLVEKIGGITSKIIDDDGREVLIKGSDLIGLEYEPLFPGVIKNNGKAFRVYSANFVNTTEGTGVVHTAVMYGEDDYELGLAEGLPAEHSVGEDGRFLAHVPEGLAGKYVKAPETENLIIESLQSRGLLLSTESYSHEYPFCWRCDTPLLYYARSSWFIQMSSLKNELLEANDSVNWEPASIKNGRMGEWLENVKDWAISRDRYWGTPLPFWVCQNNHLTVVESSQELQRLMQKSITSPQISKLDDLHRPFIDQISFNCPECGEISTRVPEVADVWLDSGAMSFAQWGYPHTNGSIQFVKSHYPADFIAEAVDQTRGWFYTLLAVAAIMGESAPYKNVICLGHLLDEHGKKMSKSKGNVVDPWVIIDKFGADALRFYLYSLNPAGEPKLFSEKDLQTVSRRVLMIWWNTYLFFEQRQMTNDQRLETRNQRQETGVEKKSPNVLDRWILARVNITINIVTTSLDQYDVLTASRALSELIDDTSTWYLRRSRGRFAEENDATDRENAIDTLRFVLITSAKLMAPFCPFMADAIYFNLTGESVHLADWPVVPHQTNDDIISDMIQVRQIVSSGLEARMQAEVKIRQPLVHLIVTERRWSFDNLDDYLDIIKAELNVIEISFHSGDGTVFKKPELDYIELANGKTLLSTTITPELAEAGMVRELTRAIQDLRKSAGLSIYDQAQVKWHSQDQVIIELLSNIKILESLSLATRSHLQMIKSDTAHSIDLNGHNIELSLS